MPVLRAACSRLAVDERARKRLELRQGNRAQPHRNRYREAKIDPPWWADLHDAVGEEYGEEDESADCGFDR